MPTNRVVAVAATVISLALAVLPVVGNMDWASTAGVIAGVIAVLGVTQTWLQGWQKHEARQALDAAFASDTPGAVQHTPLAAPVNDESLSLLPGENDGALEKARARAAAENPPIRPVQ